MGILFWIRRFCTVFAIAFAVIGGSQWLRGHTVEYAAMHGLIWSAISASVFIATRLYYIRRGQACALCGDMPQNQTTQCRNQ